jgi:hypothetical protein
MTRLGTGAELDDRLSAAIAHSGPSLVHVRSDVAVV